MGLFNNEDKTNISIQMNGKEYIEFKNQRKGINKLNKSEKILIAVLALIAGLCTVLIYLIYKLTYVAPSITPFNPINFIIICLGIGWIIHGVGFMIIKG